VFAVSFELMFELVWVSYLVDFLLFKFLEREDSISITHWSSPPSLVSATYRVFFFFFFAGPLFLKNEKKRLTWMFSLFLQAEGSS